MWYRFLVLLVAFCLPLYSHTITVDGNDDDWIGTPGPTGSLAISFREAIYVDYVGDDLGDGGDAPYASDNPSAYSYPTDAVFLGTEADILEWRVTGDPSNDRLYFLIRLAYNTVWVPIVGIACDLDHIPHKGMDDAGLYSQVRLNPVNSWEYLIKLVNMNAVVYDTLWNTVSGSHQNWFSTDNDLIEVGIDVSNWNPKPWNRTVYFTVYAGLNEWDNCRPIYDYASQWYGGGGCAGGVCVNPRVYDLCFCTPAQQNADLSNYTNVSWTELSATTVGAVDMRMLTGDHFPQYYGGYDPSHPAKVHINVRMKGVAFSIDDTNWDLTESGTYYMSPNEVAIRGGIGHQTSSPFLLQNDGGVFIDLFFSTQDLFGGPGDNWLPVALIDPTDYTTFPSMDFYYVEPWITNVEDPYHTPPTDETSFSGMGLTETDEEATNMNWAYYYSNATNNGVKLPAFVPANPTNGDRLYIYMLFIAPAGSTTLDPHPIIVNVTAGLSDP